MQNYDHSPTVRGRAFLWGGLALGIIVLAALLTDGFGLLGAHKSAPEAPLLLHRGVQILIPEGSPLRQRLVIQRVQAAPVSGSVIAPGVVESNPARTAAVLPALGGRVQALEVALGDRVVSGQTLALVDSPDLAQAYDDDAKAADALHLTEKNLERQQGQHNIGASSDRDLDQARSDHAQAAAEYARTEARLRTLGVSTDPARRTRLLVVRAPLDGSITALAVAAGNMINDPTQSIMTVADLNTVWVTAMVAEKDVAQVYKRQEAQVAVDAYPGEMLNGTVLFVSDVVDSDSHRTKVRIAFANPQHVLRPGMFTTVSLLGPRQSRVVLPASALLMNNDRTSAFVEVSPWVFERRTVDAELQEGQTAAIRAGVNPGDQVVIQGGILLND
jgi:cobalt-zinc-cadmium efflux system membrane fusion protein